MNSNPEIFNDITGPVMRGPSSSHTTAAWRIARTCLDILGEPLQKAITQFDKDGAWASNFREQGTSMGINGGLLGLDITDIRMKNTESMARQKGISIDFEIASFPPNHSNTVRMMLQGTGERTVTRIAVSTGGGAFEFREIDGCTVHLCSDSYSMLIRTREPGKFQNLFEKIDMDPVSPAGSSPANVHILQLDASVKFDPSLIREFKNHRVTEALMLVNPVLNIVAGNGSDPPFTDVATALE